MAVDGAQEGAFELGEALAERVRDGLAGGLPQLADRPLAQEHGRERGGDRDEHAGDDVSEVHDRGAGDADREGAGLDADRRWLQLHHRAAKAEVEHGLGEATLGLLAAGVDRVAAELLEGEAQALGLVVGEVEQGVLDRAGQQVRGRAEVIALELAEDRGLELVAKADQVLVAAQGDLRAALGDRALDLVEVDALLHEGLADLLELGLQGGGLEAQRPGLDRRVMQQQVDAALEARAGAGRQDGRAAARQALQTSAQATDLACADALAVG